MTALSSLGGRLGFAGLMALFGSFIVWVALADAAGLYASRLGRGRLYWFCVALVLSPIVAWAYLVGFGPANIVDCPFCAEPIKEEAIRCPHCHSNLEEETREPEPAWWKARRQ